MKNGKKYLRITQYDLKINPEKVSMSFSGLFPDNKVLSEQITKTLEENEELLFQEIKGPFSEAFSSIQKELSNRFYSRVPMDEVFLN